MATRRGQDSVTYLDSPFMPLGTERVIRDGLGRLVELGATDVTTFGPNAEALAAARVGSAVLRAAGSSGPGQNARVRVTKICLTEGREADVVKLGRLGGRPVLYFHRRGTGQLQQCSSPRG
jgi:sirohydrochlorin ferrochelatase